MDAISGCAKSRRIVLLSGNSARPSGSRRLAARIGEAMLAHMSADLVPLDLVDAGQGLGFALTRSDLPPEAERVVSELENADALVVVTPVYNGSYPGLFKHLVDFLDRGVMAGKPVLLGASAGSRRHEMMIENQLMPLFGHFRAQISAYSVFDVDEKSAGDHAELSLVSERINRAARHFSRILAAPAHPLTP